MEVPVLLPQQLTYVQNMDSDSEVFDRLSEEPRDLILFFEVAAADEAWALAHGLLLKKILEWLTEEFFLGRLSQDLIQRTQNVVYAHSEVMSPIVPKDLVLHAADKTFSVNSLLLGQASPLLMDKITRECIEKEVRELSISGLSPKTAEAFAEYVQKGVVETLWKEEHSVILKAMEEASQWALTPFIDFCGTVLARYFDENNVFSFLEIALKQHWEQFRDSGIKWINRQNYGFILSPVSVDTLQVELLNLRVPARNRFHNVQSFTSHLAMHGEVSNDEHLSDILDAIPDLKGLDVSETTHFGCWLEHVSETLEELDLSRCEWLDDKTLSQIVQRVPRLHTLKLNQNTQLDYRSWSLLGQLENLAVLEVTGCRQITDQDLTLIKRECPSLRTLSA